MRHTYRNLLAFLAIAFLLSACHSVPDHARYLPKDATVVVGVNTNVLNKKIAWSAITGSKLIDELEKGSEMGAAREKMEDLKNAGISYSSTLYYYFKTDNRYPSNSKMGLVLPLSSESKWEAYLKKNFPAATIASQKDFKTAMLDDKALAGWNKDVLVIQNPLRQRTSEQVALAAPEGDTTGTEYETIEGWGAVDEPATLAEIQNTFSLKKENSLVKDDHFSRLAKEDNDISVFVNYSNLMDAVSAAGMGMGTGMAQSLWQNAALTAGINFKDGLIASDMHFFPSQSMEEVTEKMSGTNVDKDLVNRLPGNNLNMVMAYHLSTDGLRAMMDKMGLLGMMNLGLSAQGLNVDEILNAFTGDLAFTVNNFRMEEQTVTVDSFLLSYMDTADLKHWEPSMDFLFAMKIKNKASIDKLLALAKQQGLQDMGNGHYQMGNMPGGGHLLLNNDYLAAGNNLAQLQAFINNKTATGLQQPASGIVTGHPLGYFIDAQSMLQQVPLHTAGGGTDSALLAESQKLFKTVTVTGGDFKKQSLNYHMEVNLMDKSENALLQVLQMIQNIAAVSNSEKAATAKTAVVPAPAP